MNLPSREVLDDTGTVGLVSGMAVCDKNIAVRTNGDAGRPVEQVLPVSADAFSADRHQHRASRTDLQDFLSQRRPLGVFRGHPENGLAVVGVGRPDVSLTVDGEPVRVRKQSDSETLDQLAGGAEFQDGRVRVASIETRRVATRLVVEASLKHPDVTVGSDVHSDDLAPFVTERSFHRGGQRRPVCDQAIGIREIGRLRKRFVSAGLALGAGRQHRNRGGTDHGGNVRAT